MPNPEHPLIPYARLRPGPGFELSGATLYYLQRLAGPRWLRDAVAALIARGVAVRHPSVQSGSVSSLRYELAQNGLVSLPELVSKDVLESALSYLEDKQLKTSDGRMVRLQDIPSDVTIADYPLETVLACPAIIELINAAPVLALAGSYLGCSPTLSSVGLRWSFPSASGPCDVQRFHRDPDDWRFVKLFIYLTDVDHESGPHVYVQGSHKTGRGIRAHSYDAEKLKKQYGKDSITPVMGKTGTAFMADTNGIHMGAPPRHRPRLLLAAQYSLLPVYAFRYTPLKIEPRPPIDSYVNRLLIA